MPNWCLTTYKCVGSKEEIKKLSDIIKSNEERESPRVESDFGNLWLGCIIDNLGEDWTKNSCRGYILNYEVSQDGEMLTIEQETAWYEQTGFRNVIEKHFPTIKVYYLNLELGMCVFDTNDLEGTYFPENYYIDDDTCETRLFKDLESAAEWLSEIYEENISAEDTKSFLERLESDDRIVSWGGINRRCD